MKFDPAGLSWVDLIILAVLIIGMIRGRKRGMSEELLDLLKWLLIVVVAAYFYQPIGDFLALNSMFSRLAWYLTIYLAVAVGIKILFSLIKNSVGEKLVGSDIFGRAEYYLGMTSGVIRYACVIILIMAVMNARQFSREEIEANRKMQNENFGTISFPTHSSLQQDLLEKSFVGSAVKSHLSLLLIKPTRPEQKGLGRAGALGKSRNDLNEVLKSTR